MQVLFPREFGCSQEVLDRGTRQHAYMQWVMEWTRYRMTGEGSEPHAVEIMDEEIPRVEALTKWCEKMQIIPVAIEQRVENLAHGYCGTPDLVGKIGSVLWGFDWKFAETIMPQNRIQGEAYRHLVPGSKVMLVQIKRDLTIIPHKLSPDPAIWAEFLSAKNVWHARRKYASTDRRR